MEIKDLRKFKFISDPQVSPDGSKVAFVYTTIDYDKNGYTKHIWIWDRSSGSTEQFTHGQCSDSYPRWSPDGQWLLFISSGRQPDKTNAQIYVIPTSGGEVRFVADSIVRGIRQPMWAPDSKRILFLSGVWTEGEPESDVVVVKNLKYKWDGVSYFAGTRIHLHMVELGGTQKQLTEGDFDVDMAKWSPDGKNIALISNTAAILRQPYTDPSTRNRWPEPVLEPELSFIRDIYVMPTEGGEMRRLTPNKHVIRSFSWSPMGDEIAFLGHDFRKVDITNVDVWVIPSEGGEPVNLTGSFDRTIGSGNPNSDMRVSTPSPGVVWAPDSSSLYFVAMSIPTSNIYRIDRKSKNVEQLTEGKSVDGFSLSADGKIMSFNAMDLTHPADLWVMDKKGERRVTSFNDELLEGLKLSTPEHFTFTNEVDMEVDGWVVRPANYEKGKKYPTVLKCHGGRVNCFGEAFFFEIQVLAANGFAVIYTNSRGSGGYGEDYRCVVWGNQGVLRLKDTMKFVDAAIDRYPFIDADRLGVTGGSAGGFLTNWIITHTDRFKAAVPCRTYCNSVSCYGTSDSRYNRPDRDTGDNDYIDNMMKHMEHSPLLHVKNVVTPTLIIHSENDYRCPMEQAEQWFTALKLFARVPTEMVRFPGESHGVSRNGKPIHREERLHHIVRWFNKYLKT